MRKVLPALFLLSLSSFGFAASAEPFLAPGSLDWNALLPPPVSPASVEQHAELDLIVAAQSHAAAAQRKAAKEQSKEMDVNTFADILGPWFVARDLPKTEALFAEIEFESKRLITSPAKNFYKRIRPADADSRIIGHENAEKFSYPSGHSTRATVYAYVLAALFPDLKEALVTRAQEIGFNRIIAGAHYPSDVVAGRMMGKVMSEHLLATPRFRAALAECKAELDAARAAATVPLAHATH